MSSTPELHSHQILCLDHEHTTLYGELIQFIPDRDICWLRPFALIRRLQQEHEAVESLYDLRESADLLYPKFLFRRALDTEVLPILTQLDGLKTGHPVTPPTDTSQIARQQLQCFAREVWQAYPEAFHQ